MHFYLLFSKLGKEKRFNNNDLKIVEMKFGRNFASKSHEKHNHLQLMLCFERHKFLVQTF